MQNSRAVIDDGTTSVIGCDTHESVDRIGVRNISECANALSAAPRYCCQCSRMRSARWLSTAAFLDHFLGQTPASTRHLPNRGRSPKPARDGPIANGRGGSGHIRHVPELSFVPSGGRGVKRAATRSGFGRRTQVQAGAEAAGDARAPGTLPNSPGLAIWLFYPAKLEQGMA